MNEQKILDVLNIIQVEVTCPSGAVSKTESNNAGDQVFTDGTVRYMDRKLLSPFTSARQAAARVCRNAGTKFLGGWAVPDDSLNKVRAELETIAAEFEKEKTALEAKLPNHRLDWETDHPQISQYAHRFPTTPEVMAGICIRTAAYKIQPRHMESISGTDHDGISAGIKGLAGQILSEIAQDAKDAFSPEAIKASSRAKNVLLRAKAKLESLAFVDASLSGVSKMIGDTLAVLPKDGPLQGQDFTIYAGLMNTLMQPDQVVAIAGMLKIDDKNAAWSAFCPQGSASAEPGVTEQAPPAPRQDSTGPESSGSLELHCNPAASANVVPFRPAPPLPVEPPSFPKASNWKW